MMVSVNFCKSLTDWHMDKNSMPTDLHSLWPKMTSPEQNDSTHIEDHLALLFYSARMQRHIIQRYLFQWYQVSLNFFEHLTQNHKYWPHCGAKEKNRGSAVIRIHPLGTTNGCTNVIAISLVVIKPGPQTHAASESKNTIKGDKKPLVNFMVCLYYMFAKISLMLSCFEKLLAISYRWFNYIFYLVQYLPIKEALFLHKVLLVSVKSIVSSVCAVCKFTVLVFSLASTALSYHQDQSPQSGTSQRYYSNILSSLHKECLFWHTFGCALQDH